jgi:hypothetical protein
VIIAGMLGCHAPATIVVNSGTSTFDIYLHGHTYNLAYTKGDINMKDISIDANTLFPNPAITFSAYQFSLYAGQPKLVSVTISGAKRNSPTDTGIYNSGNYLNGSKIINYGTIEIIDDSDGNKIYEAINDTLSSIYVAVSNDTEIKGMFNLKVTRNDTIYPVTGHFDYKK